jgi:hypothetical protein
VCKQDVVHETTRADNKPIKADSFTQVGRKSTCRRGPKWVPRVNGLTDGVRHVSRRQRVLTYPLDHRASSDHSSISNFLIIFFDT